MDYDRYIRVKHLDRYQEQFNGSKIHRYLMLIHLHNSSFHIKCNYLSRYHKKSFRCFYSCCFICSRYFFARTTQVLLKQYRNDSRDVASYIDDRVLLLVRLYTASYFLFRTPKAITFIKTHKTYRETILLVIFFGQIFSNIDIIINRFLFIYVNNPTWRYFKIILCHAPQVAPS